MRAFAVVGAAGGACVHGSSSRLAWRAFLGFPECFESVGHTILIGAYVLSGVPHLYEWKFLVRRDQLPRDCLMRVVRGATTALTPRSVTTTHVAGRPQVNRGARLLPCVHFILACAKNGRCHAVRAPS